MNPTKPQSRREYQSAEEYISENFKCEPPCDSHGVCNNCCDARLVRVGASLERDANPPPENTQRLTESERERLKLVTERSKAFRHWKLKEGPECFYNETHGPDVEFLLELVERLSAPPKE